MNLPHHFRKPRNPAPGRGGRRSPACGIGAFVALLAILSPAQAQITYFTGAVNSDWQNAGNWDNGVPNMANIAEINGADAVLGGASAESAGLVRIQQDRTLTVNGGSTLNVLRSFIGNNGTNGSMVVSGAGTSVNNEGFLGSGPDDIVIGVGAGSIGTLTVSNQGLFTAPAQLGEFSLGFNSSTGNIILNSGGTLAAGDISILGNGSFTMDNGVFRARINTTNVFRNFGAGDFILGAGGGAIDTNGFNITATNVISGTGSLTKQGTGTLTLSGTNTYSGSTTISTGTLRLGATGSIQDSSGIDIASGATFDVSGLAGGFTLGASQTLSGNGTILGNVTTAGTLSPGSSPGILNITGDYTQSESGVLDIEIAGLVPGTEHDVLDVTGTVTLAGVISFTLDNFSPEEDDFFQILRFGSLVDNGFVFDFSSAALNEGLSWNTSQFLDTGSVFVSFSGTSTAIPEPSSLATVASLSALALAITRRRPRPIHNPVE